MRCPSNKLSLVLAVIASVSFANFATAEEPTTFQLADGKLSLKAPAGWKKVEPKSRIVEHEFAVKAAEGDTADGRVTVMGAGGSIEANIDRWLNQFTQPDGSNTKDTAKIEKKTVGKNEIHLVDVSGTYQDSPGPFAGGKVIERPEYRMLAAIIVTPKESNLGNYFVKFYGPKKTVEAAAKGFAEMVASLETK